LGPGFKTFLGALAVGTFSFFVLLPGSEAIFPFHLSVLQLTRYKETEHGG
jgi:hypothetical protein